MTCFKKAASGELHGSWSKLHKPNWNTHQLCVPRSETGRQLLVAAIIRAHFRTEQPYAFSDSRPASG
jgi:hypothetical protein